ncbi:response regulator [Lampropedia puyangensis]|uniref:Chemotaxis protein CheA n=2 Tax=Lampropedia puyangensis TaxID=1330072 RepID=A0A4S8EY77_9BURK|nr:response regulator [Lampropedia puyangensis]
MEQLMNGWLAEQKPFTAPMHQLCSEALGRLELWVGDIANKVAAPHWNAQDFERAAQVMRAEQRYESLDADARAVEAEVASINASENAIDVEAAHAVELDQDTSKTDEWSLDTRAIDLGDWNESKGDVAPTPEKSSSQAGALSAQIEMQDASKLAEAIRSLDALELPDLDLDWDVLDTDLAPPMLDVDGATSSNSEVPAKPKAQMLDHDLAELLDSMNATEIGGLPADALPENRRAEPQDVDASWQSTIYEPLNDETQVAGLPSGMGGEVSDVPQVRSTTPQPAPSQRPVDKADALDATENLLASLDNSLARSEADAVRWGVSFKETEIAAAPSLEPEDKKTPEISLAADASLLADLDALGEEIEPMPSPQEAVAFVEEVKETTAAGDEGTVEPEPSFDVETAAQVAQDLIEVGQDDETYWLLQILQLTQELEEKLQTWMQHHGATFLPQEVVAQTRALVAAGAYVQVDASFVHYLEKIEQVATFFAAHQASKPADVCGTLTQSLQQVQTAMDGIVAGVGNGSIHEPEFAQLQDLIVQWQSHVFDQPLVADLEPVPLSSALQGATSAVQQDLVDPDLFPIFEEEAIDLLPRLVGALRRWLGDPQSFDARSESLRVLHTLKGSSRLAGARQIGEMAHRFESDIEAIEAKATNESAIGQLLTQYDELQQAFDALRGAANAQQESQTLVVGGAVDALVSSTVERARQQPAAEPSLVSGTIVPEPAMDATAQPVDFVPAMGVSFGADLPGPTPLVIQTAQKRQQTVRVRSAHINRLINQAGEIQISRSRAESRLRQLNAALDGMTVDLDRLRHQLRELEVQSESQMQSRMALGKDSANFDPLELDRFTRVQELTRMMAETVNDVATVQRTLQAAMIGTEDDLVAQERKGRELQRDLLHTRMVEFDSVAERLHAVVRQASADTGKKVELVIENGRIEMDRVLLDRMMGGFEHILRNCVDHGIESTQERAKKGKPATGTITLTVNHEGNDVSISFRDDGAGLDLEAIKHKGIERGLIGAAQTVSERELSNLIFMPGFTTAHELTGISGRGIGMDVVRVEVSALGGRIETSTQKDAGTTFRLIMPLTTAVTQVLLVRSGSLTIGVPANLVDGIERISQDALDQAYTNGLIEIDGHRIPFYWSGALLQHSARSQELTAKTYPLVLVRSAAQVVAVHVDEVLGNQEVVVKNLGSQLSALPGLAGMSVLASGAVLLVYNFIALASVYGELAHNLQRNEASDTSALIDAGLLTDSAAEQQIPLVLVVDDSITVRRVTQRLLKREGYRVALAAHGAQALEMLAQEIPAVMLSDIEMPQMDGFELLQQVREDARYASLPVVMITSRTAQKHREHAMQLGANHYLGKPYSDAELLALVHEYAHAPEAQEMKVH